MRGKGKFAVVFAVAALLGAAAFSAFHHGGGAWERLFGQCGELEEVLPDLLPSRPTLTLWYTDEALEDYLAGAAVHYMEENDVRVLPVLVSGLDYLEAVNEASLKQENMPDLYLVTNDILERAHLAGLADEIRDTKGFATSESFSQTALRAVTYRGKRVAWPFYYETSALVYNSTYLEQAAMELGVKESDLIPETIDDILSFADVYNAPETVDAVFRWDVSDIFYNYFFAGNYINVGGPCGDDPGQIDIYNAEAVRGLKAYQDLNQFFSIDAKSSSYDAVVQDFLDGRLVFTVATSDILARIADARAEGSFPYGYGVVPLPDIDGTLATRGLSVTDALAVNGYSEKKDLANAFAAWLVCGGAGDIYAGTGRLPALLDAVPDVPGAEGFAAEYADSISMPKMMRTANFWVSMEIAYMKAWEGENVSDMLKDLSEQIMEQVTGVEYTEEAYIEVPTEEQEAYPDLPEETQAAEE